MNHEAEQEVVRWEERGGEIALFLVGSLGTFYAEQVLAAALKVLQAGRDVRLELAAVESLDVATLQVLLALERALAARSRGLRLGGSSPAVGETLAALGMKDRWVQENAAAKA